MIKRYQVGKRLSRAVAGTPSVFVGGQVPTNRTGTVEEQTMEVLQKIDNLLAEAGTNKSRLLSVTVYVANMADFAAMNSVYDAWIDPENPPARACVEARLADPNIRVEMTAVASV